MSLFQCIKGCINLLILWLSVPLWAWAQDDGTVYDPAEFVDQFIQRKEYYVRMSDGVRLATDVYIPRLQEDFFIEGLTFLYKGDSVHIPRLKVAEKGWQFVQYPGQDDPLQLPVVFSRTPYDKDNNIQARLTTMLGYCAIHQDTRGRFNSEGVDFPFYSDGYNKRGYVDVPFPLDTTSNWNVYDHEDGHESLQWIAHQLKQDRNGNGLSDPEEPLLCNGSIGMLGISDMAWNQYRAASVTRTDPNGRGLKCLTTLSGGGEFYNSMSVFNGTYMPRSTRNYLTRRLVEMVNYDTLGGDYSVYNSIHSLGDYGPDIEEPQDLVEVIMDHWVEPIPGHPGICGYYPYTPERALLDISKAYLDEQGRGTASGTVSRYSHMQIPNYATTGWWDVNLISQITTWRLLMENAEPEIRPLLKLVICPSTHASIGCRNIGDMKLYEDASDPYFGRDYRYKENVGKILGFCLDEVATSSLPSFAGSEVVSWLRYNLGKPHFVLKPIEQWQPVGKIKGREIEVMVPADTFSIPYESFIQFMNGDRGLKDFPIRVKGDPFSSARKVQYIDVPPLETSLLGPSSASGMAFADHEFHADKPGGLPPVRYYVVGPINDGIEANRNVGNYWAASDTFPLRDLPRLKLYFHPDGTLSDQPPKARNGEQVYYNDPDAPVQTLGGPNHLIMTPDERTYNQGQMDFTHPYWVDFALRRPWRTFGKDSLQDMVAFTSPPLADTLSIVGFPEGMLYAAARAVGTPETDSTNCDYFVRVLDVCPDGRELYVFEGAVNARARDYARRWAETGREQMDTPFSNIVYDRMYPYHFRMFPTGYTWGVGHRIKVLVSSSNYPKYQACPNLPLRPHDFFRREPGDGQTCEYRGKTLRARTQLQAVGCNASSPSHLILPLKGGQFEPMDLDTFAELLPEQTDTQAVKADEVMRIYPNPATDFFTIKMPEPGQYEFVLYDPFLKVVYRAQFSDQMEVKVRQFIRGRYVIEVRDLKHPERTTKNTLFLK